VGFADFIMFSISLFNLQLYLIFGKGFLQVCNKYSTGMLLFLLGLELLDILLLTLLIVDKKGSLQELEIICWLLVK